MNEPSAETTEVGQDLYVKSAQELKNPKKKSRFPSARRGGPIAGTPWIVLEVISFLHYVCHTVEWFARKEAQRLAIKYDDEMTVYRAMDVHFFADTVHTFPLATNRFIVIASRRDPFAKFASKPLSRFHIREEGAQYGVAAMTCMAIAKYKPARMYGSAEAKATAELPEIGPFSGVDSGFLSAAEETVGT